MASKRLPAQELAGQAANYSVMQMRRRAPRQRGALLLAGGLLVAVVGLDLWKAAHPTATTPVDQLREVLRAPMVAATAVRDGLTPAPQPPSAPLTPEAQAYVDGLRERADYLEQVLQLQTSRLERQPIAVEVIGRGQNPWQQYLILGKGSNEGLEPRMVVESPEGILGQVLNVTAHTAEVLPLTADRAGGIGAKTQRSGATGALEGFRNGTCQLQYLPITADVQPGDLVVTSGLGHVFPPNLTLGTVVSVAQTPDLSSQTAIVQPAADPSRARVVVVFK